MSKSTVLPDLFIGSSTKTVLVFYLYLYLEFNFFVRIMYAKFVNGLRRLWR